MALGWPGSFSFGMLVSGVSGLSAYALLFGRSVWVVTLRQLVILSVTRSNGCPTDSDSRTRRR